MSLRLISILILLGTMPVYSVYAQENHTCNFDDNNGFCTVDGCTSYQQPNGTGTESDPYQIANAGNLYWFAEHVNECNTNPGTDGYTSADNAKLMNDIVVNENVLNENGEPNEGTFRPWIFIGDNIANTYKGTFDGDGHTISGLYYNDENKGYVGLFSYAEGCTIQDLGVIDSYFNAKDYVGGIVGNVYSTISITNCYSISKISGAGYLGGIAGWLTSGSTVSNCYNEGSISGSGNHVGGIAGYNVGTVSDSYNAGSVSSSAGYWVGGIAGRNNGGTVSNCYNTGSINASSDAGGIVGQNTHEGSVSNCYNEALITTIKSEVGGIVGNNLASVSNCYNSGKITGTSNVGGIVGRNYVSDGANVSNCYYLDGTATNGIGGVNASQDGTISKTSAQFASGEVAYLLQGSQETQIWGQNIDNGEERQNYPVLSDAKVYYINGSYTNNYVSETVFWSYENGVLTIEGEGSIPNYEQTSTKPWSNYLSNINTVVVKAGITEIGSYAFSDIKDGAEIILYGTTAPSLETSCFNADASVYIPAFSWTTTNWSPVPTVMPTYTSTGWQMPSTAKSTEPSSTDHVAINANMTINSDASLSVNSFGYCSDDVRITIQDGGQLTCQQANGEVTVEKEIQSYSQEPTAKSQSSTNWYTISSPLKESVYATSVTNLIDETADNYALYRYDEPSYTWQNYKYQDNNFTTLDAGRGYLYANKNGVTLSFEGKVNTESVSYDLTVGGDNLTGFHLIGNPFTHNITSTNLSVPTGVTLASGYYVLSNQGAWAADPSTDGDIKPGQGILIKTTAAGTLTINPTQQAAKGQQPRANSQQPMLSLNVSNGNYSDRAFVIFGKGIGLDKINHQNEDIPVLYIPMSDADYAIAMMDESVNEIPVGFESSSMGEFTISLRQENCEFEELYLLDKETGAKVNILEQDYTFMTTSGDNAERFVLLMDNGQQTADNSNFAYISNNDIVIYDVEGNAHIDIYDVLGRRVYNTTGRDDVHIVSTDGYSAGVYVIRLMDENGLRTQKVVIE